MNGPSIVLYLTLLLVPRPQAESNPPANATPTEKLNQYIKEQRQAQSDAAKSQISPDLSFFSVFDKLDEPTKTAAMVSLREYFEYRASGYRHRKNVFEWQLISSKMIFVIVIVLVSTGVCFSGIQFRQSLSPRASSVERKEGSSSRPNAEQLQPTEIEATLRGIKVSSPILGVVILAISFLFFYLY